MAKAKTIAKAAAKDKEPAAENLQVKEQAVEKARLKDTNAKNLVAILGIGKGTWGHVARLIAENEWTKIYLVSNEWGKENFQPSKECEWVLVNNRMGFELLQQQIQEKLPEKGEFAVSLISGSGKEHMALISALKNKGLKHEFIVITGEGTKYI